MRVGALQLWPVLLKQRITPCFTAFSGASAKMMLAPLPPSSRLTRLIVSAAAFEISRPARVEPVKLTMSTSGCAESWLPTPSPSPFTRLKTPGGSPASSTISAKSRLDSGAISEGFSTIVQPARSAGTTFRTTWFIGQFHGVISAQTPMGSWMMRSPGAQSPSGCSQSKAFAARRKPSMCQVPAVAWLDRARSMGAPISCEIAAAMSSRRAE